MDIRLNLLVHVFHLEPAKNDYMNSHGHQTLIKISILYEHKKGLSYMSLLPDSGHSRCL